MTQPKTERYVDPAVLRDRERRQKRNDSVAAIDFTRGRHRDVAARDVKPGMVVDRLVYSYVTDLPEFHTDVVTEVKPNSSVVGGVVISFSDGTSSGFGGDHVFDRTWVPFKPKAEKKTAKKSATKASSS